MGHLHFKASSKLANLVYSFVGIFFLVTFASAAPLPGAGETYPYESSGEPIRDALKTFGRNVRLPVKISGEITGTTEGVESDLSQERYLDELALRGDFVWYFDGAVVIFVARDLLVSEAIVLEKSRSSEIVHALRSFGLLEEQFVSAGDWFSKALFVSGPPEYVERVTEIAKQLDAKDPANLTVFRGRRSGSGAGAGGLASAGASDSVQQSQVTLPEIVTSPVNEESTAISTGSQ